MAGPALPAALAVTSAAAKAALKSIPKTQATKLKKLTDKVGKKDDAKSNDDLMDYVEKLKGKYGRQVEDLADDLYRSAFKMPAKKAGGGKTVNKKIGGAVKTAAKKKKPQSGHNRLY